MASARLYGICSAGSCKRNLNYGGNTGGACACVSKRIQIEESDSRISDRC